MKYDPQDIEPRWQAHWAQQRTFAAPNPGDDGFDDAKPRFYVLDMFPYPSGVGLHVGHPVGYIATDIAARYQRMRGYNVLHPMGFDAFGLPAEQYAVETGVHPRETTRRNIDNMVGQLKRLGLGYDWDRRFSTTDTDYYKWTQWIFLQLYNSWFDPWRDAARPIDELEQLLEAGDLDVGFDGELIDPGAMSGFEPIAGNAPGTRRWQELAPDQQRRLIDEYRLAYLAEVDVNWCPALGTVLANEEVTADGRSERGNHPVHQRPLRQWMLRITAYAERLIDDLDIVDWPEPIKLMQRNWIGRSEGAHVEFPLDAPTPGDEPDAVGVFTTRPDTLFGATYMVLAPEHPLVRVITTAVQRQAVDRYVRDADRRSELERQNEARDKTGVFTGAHAVNPVNDDRIPIWIADYVMMGYGTGAIMAVPAHDHRDFDFARKFGLPIRAVVEPTDDWLRDHRADLPEDAPDALRSAYHADAGRFDEAYTGPGRNVNSANDEISLDGETTDDAKRSITDWLHRKGLGEGQTQYKLRDWLFSRQRYWGEPFPILHGPDGEIVALDESDLAVELPEMTDFAPEPTDDPNAPPRPPLARAPESWRIVERDGVRYERELNTMPQWAGSCWYYLRFCDPHNTERFVSEQAEQYWMAGAMSNEDDDHGRTSRNWLEPAPSGGVDLYVGGVEHAVLHLLYARFWHKVLYDLGHVSTPEPFGRLFNQGYIQAYCYRDARGIVVPADEVVDQDGKPAMDVQDQPNRRFSHNGQPVTQEYGKMGKSLKNAVNPDDIGARFGTDTLRLYLMYMGPLEASKPWNTRDIVGVHRFLNRVWRNLVDEDTGDTLVTDDHPSADLERNVHRTIQRVTRQMESLGFNVAIAAMIELNNELVAMDRVPRLAAETLVRLLAPFAPHLAEELWQRLGHAPSVADADWPDYDETMLVEERIELPVQVNGKLRGRITVPADADDDAIEAAARGDAKVADELVGKTVRKVIVVKGKLINIVAQ
ncbi:MAG: leucine--tRNA ligase [Phycisphaeraceae bacterium]